MGASGEVRLVRAVVVACLVVVACTGDDRGSAGGDEREKAEDGAVVELRPLHVSDDDRIVDDLDREVLLRGANVNSLGEYWQGDPGHEPTLPVTEEDWDVMASHGFSVVRLIVSWSRIQPERGVVDQGYLDEIDAYVTAAAEHGIYTVIDMHQDAYSASIFTEDSAECGPGTTPAKGWDGAPEWATLTTGLSTCVTGGARNSSPAVRAAWNHFYDNTDGIRDELAAAWVAVAERFAGRPEVAGYDLLNEPEVSRPAAELTPLYEELLADTITAIREAEAEAEAPFEHLVVVEEAVPSADIGLGLIVPDPARMGIDDGNIVLGSHNYAESILGFVTIETWNDLILSNADTMGVPAWIGEYGFWDRSPETLEKITRYAADEDANRLGGAWWQWRQGCGDPHSVEWGTPAEGEITHLNVLDCPGDGDLGPNEEFLYVLGRGYPRAAPGRLTELTSDHETGRLELRAAGARTGAELVVWTPTSADTHTVTGDGLDRITAQDVPGGRIVTATVADGDYHLEVAPT